MVLDSVHPVDHYHGVGHPHKVCQQKVPLQEKKQFEGFGRGLVVCLISQPFWRPDGNPGSFGQHEDG